MAQPDRSSSDHSNMIGTVSRQEEMLRRLTVRRDELVRREVTLDDEWLAQFRAWLTPMRGAAEALSWMMALGPASMEPELVWPDGIVMSYMLMEWTSVFVPRFSAAESIPWLVTHKDGTRLCFDAVACEDGHRVAHLRSVIDLSKAAPDAVWGKRDTPAPPLGVDRFDRTETVVITEHEFEEFESLVTRGSRLHDDVAFAWAHGYKNLIAPASVVIKRILRHASVPRRGTLEIWFRRPVLAGSVQHLGLAASADATTYWQLRQGSHVTVAGRLVDPISG